MNEGINTTAFFYTYFGTIIFGVLIVGLLFHFTIRNPKKKKKTS